jgi:hypothetical protein
VTGSATGAARVAKLGILSLAMINVASIVSARNLPVMAEYGWAMLLLFLLSILVFLIPISMAAAELGTGWPRAGGVYAWVKQAFGGRAGFLAVWCDYAENIAWFPTVLSFIAASLAYAINPALANNNVFLVVVMLAFFWATTAASLLGVRASAAIGAIGTIAGSIVLAILVVVLGAAFLLQGNPSQIPFTPAALVPDIELNNLAFLGGIILLFTGMEMAGFPRAGDPRPGPDGAAGDLPGGRGHGAVLGVRVAVHGIRAAAARDQPGLRDDGTVLQRARQALARLAACPARPRRRTRRGRPPRPLDPRPRQGRRSRGRRRPGPRAPRPGQRARRARDRPRGPGDRRLDLLSAVPVRAQRQHLVLDALRRHRPGHDHHVRADVRRGDPAPLLPAGHPAALLHPRRPARGVADRRGGLLGCIASFLLGFIPPSQLKTGDTVVYVLLLALVTLVLSLPPFVFALLERRRGAPGSGAAARVSETRASR